MPDPTKPPDRTQEFLSKLESSIENPNHKRLIKAYASATPVASMETELAVILQEIINRED